MAGQAQNADNSENSTPDLVLPRADRDAVRVAAAKLYGQGFPRAKIARILVDYLVPNNRHRPLEQRLSQARAKLRTWEQTQKFRDMVYDLAVVKLDLQTPQILGGVAKKAKAGRVDAARLALEITGRHNPKGDSAPAQVIIAFDGIPRPQGTAQAVEANENLVIEAGEAMVVEEEDEV